MASRRGAYPGTFNPPTVAHLAVADAAREQCGLTRVDLVVSDSPLGKEDHPDLPPLAERLAVVGRVVAGRDWLHVVTSPHRLVVDIAQDYDVVIMGADKWAQLQDPRWYGSPDARDDALARLPHVALAPRPPHPVPASGPGITVLELDPSHHPVSASAVRDGEHRWRAPEVERHDPT